MYVHELLVNRLFKPAQEKGVVRCTDRPAMTIAVDLGRKAIKTNKICSSYGHSIVFFVWAFIYVPILCYMCASSAGSGETV